MVTGCNPGNNLVVSTTMGGSVDKKTVFVRAFVVWIAFVVFSGINGAIRDSLVRPELGPTMAHLYATAAVVAFVFALTGYMLKGLPGLSRAMLLAIGVFWLVLGVVLDSVVFFVLLGGDIASHTTDDPELLYTLSAVVWLTVLLSPLVWGKILRGRHHGGI